MDNPQENFGFATVSSQGYVDQTAGLLLNLREFYPNTQIVICALDQATYRAFSLANDPHLTVVSAEIVWGPAVWRNIMARMNRAERAFATKSALCNWFLTHQATALLLLDSDLLFLDRIDDLLAKFSGCPAILVAGRHGMEEWAKSNRFGLFSAGIVGLTTDIIQEVKKWKVACFENCSAVPLSGVYYEQKYLDAFVNVPGVALIHDPGINISQTFLKLMAPYQDEKNQWRVKDGTPIRIFHASRAADKTFPLYKEKELFNQRGLEKLSLETTSDVHRQAPGAESQMAKIIRKISVGRYLTKVMNGIPLLSRKIMIVYRTLTIQELPFTEHRQKILCRKHQLAQTMRDDMAASKSKPVDD